MCTSRGLTLIETLIALFIIAALSTVAIPPIYQARQNLRFSLLASHIRSELHRIRVLSIVRGEDCRFRVDTRNSYLIECQSPDWITLETRSVPQDFEISANNAPEFHPRGNVAPMATVRVWYGNDQKRIIISRSGRVRTE